MMDVGNNYSALLFRRSHVGTNRSRNTKTEVDTVREEICGIAWGTASVWVQAAWRQQDPTPNTVLRTVA